MPTLSTDNLRFAIRSNLALDAQITASEAKTLIDAYRGDLGDAQIRKVFAQELTRSSFDDASAAQAVLSSIGMTANDLPTGTASGLKGKLRNEVGKLVSKELYKQRDVSLAKIDIGDNVEFGVKAQLRLIDNRDALVRGDKFRASYTEGQIAAGKSVTWASIGGGVFPAASLSTAIPLGPSGLEATAGFSANASIGYSVLAPYEHEWSAAKDALRNVSVDLPLSAKKAKAMAPGSEVVLRGTGRVAAHAGLGIGKTLASAGDFLSVGAHAGVSVGRSAELDLSMRIKKLDGQKVLVSLSRVDTTGASVEVGAHVGVDAKSSEAIGDLGGGAWSKGGEILSKAVDKQIEKWLSADLRASHATSEVEKEVANYVIDLTQPGAAKAFESLLRLDARKADELVAEHDGFGPVRQAKQSETVRSASETFAAKLGPIKLLQAVDSASATHGIVNTAEGEYAYDRAKLADSYSGILSDNWNGKRSLQRELISVKRPTDAAPSRYYHFDYNVVDDGVTTDRDVKKMLALGRLLGAVDAEAQAAVLQPKVMDKIDNTDRAVDVYFTDAGLEAISSATVDATRLAFAKAYEQIESPASKPKLGWELAPWVAGEQPRRGEVLKLLARGPRAGSAHHRNNHNDPERRYRQLTGRSLRKDHRAHRQLVRLEELVADLKAAPNSAGQIKVFAEAKDDLGLSNFWLGLGTIAQLATPENVLVNRFAIRDRDTQRDIVFAHEGALVDPQGEINRALAMGTA